MIIREFYKMREDGINLYKTYSDSNVVIRKVNTNEKYNIAIDIEGVEYEYIETNEIIENIE